MRWLDAAASRRPLLDRSAARPWRMTCVPRWMHCARQPSQPDADDILARKAPAVKADPLMATAPATGFNCSPPKASVLPDLPGDGAMSLCGGAGRGESVIHTLE
jgi:hypothetical protein